MKLIYFDEAKNDPDYSRYHIGAVCIDEADLSAVEKHMAGIAERAFATAELSRATELHAVELYHRKGNFKKCSDFQARMELIADIVQVLSLPEVELISIQINCELLYANMQPEEIAFMYLCEKANDLMKSKGSRGLLIGDRESDKVADRFSRTLSSYRVAGTEFAYGRDIRNLVDSVHFTHSHLSRFLQLADVYVWLLQFRDRNKNSNEFRHEAHWWMGYSW